MPQPRTALIRLRNRILLGLLVNLHPGGLARCFVPQVGVTPVLSFIHVGEFDIEDLVDAPGDEAYALALVEVPAVDPVGAGALVFVGIVVARAFGDGGLGSLRLDGEG